MPCSICKKAGHTKTTCSLKIKNTIDDLTTNLSSLSIQKSAKKNIIKPIIITMEDTEESDTEESDTEESDTEESDTEESDTEESDTEELDTEESDTEESDTEESDTEELDTEESDTEESDTEESDTEESDTEEENILSSKSWKNTTAYKLICEKETQIKYYKKNNSSVEVLQLVDLDSKPFGSEAEKIIREIFKLGPRTSSENDATLNGIKIEIKTSRYWAGKNECVWQHLESNHDYEIAMFVLLDFTRWKVWCIRKSLLMGDLKAQKIVTPQGKQGHWVKMSAIIKYLTSIKTIDDLINFIELDQ